MSSPSPAPICLVSADRVLMRHVAALLRGQGHRVQRCSSLARLLSSASGAAAAIIDPRLPELGENPMSRLRAEPALHRCPVLLLRPDEVTALADDRATPELIAFMIRVHALIMGTAQLELISSVSDRLASTGDTETAMKGVLEAVVERVPTDTATMFLVDAMGRVQARAAWGYELDLDSVRTFSVGEGVVGWVVANAAATIVGDSDLDERFQSLDGRSSRSMLAVPLMVGPRVVGVLTLVRRYPAEQFTDAERVLAAIVGSSAGIALENARLSEEERALMASVAAVDRLMVEELQLVAKIETYDRMYTQVVSTVSHELKTPLMGIRGFAQMLRDDKLDGDDVRDFAGEIHDNAVRLASYVDGILTEDSVNGGRVALDIRDVRVAPLAEKVVRSLTPSLGASHRLVNAVDPGVVVRGDSDKLLQVLTNLVGNALKYSPAGGTVRLASAAGEPGYVELMVEDEGIGVPEEARSRIFDRFYRVPGAVDLGIKGTGLGLSIVGGLVELHGGRIWVTDRARGPGSSFHISLPQGAARPATERRPRPTPRAVRPLRAARPTRLAVTEMQS